MSQPETCPRCGGLIPDSASTMDYERPDQVGPARPPSWPRVLLASYASAATIACAVLWWRGLENRPPDAGTRWAAGLAAEEAAVANAERGRDGDDAGARDDRSAWIDRAEPIPDGRLVALGGSLRVGELEVTPEAIKAGPVTLRRASLDGGVERRKGKAWAWKLRLRLRNASDAAIFAPLDEAFVREPDRRLPDTFIEGADGDRVYAYRLPVASEWSIAGQSFPALRPGESAVTPVVSDAVGPEPPQGPFIWRVRLRTGPSESAVIGVTFDRDEVARP